MGRQNSRSPERARKGERLTYSVLGAGAAWLLAMAFGLLGPLADYTFIILAAGAVAATVYGIRRHRPDARLPWTLIGAAMVIFFIGGAARQALGTLGDLSPNRSLAPDLITIPGYIVLGLGLLGIARARRRGDRDLDGMLDGLVAALAAMTLAWIYLVNPALFHTHAPLGVRLLLSCYPPLSVFLVAITARLAFTAGTRSVPSYKLLLAGVIAVLVGDALYMLVETGVLTPPQHLIDLPYAVALLLLIVSELHPSMRDLTAPMPGDETAPGRGRLALVAIALGIPALISLTRVDATASDRAALALIVLALTAAATWRVFRALRAYARSEARLAHQATHDALTGLPNRTYVQDHLDLVLRRRKHDDTLVALLFLDIDRFKLVNDSHGHSLGDELLFAVAGRLRSTTRPSDIVARIGGDEFVVVVEGLRSVREALEVAERTRLIFETPFQVRGAEIVSSVSIGVSVADGSDSSVDAEALIRDSDTAMYQAKEAGRDAVTVFDASMRDRASQRLALEGDLRHALERGQLHLHYQPIVRLPSGEIEGFEALLRWAHPSRGQIPPTTFIPVAEDTGLIVSIGAWVIDEACQQLAEWRRDVPGGEGLYVSVNLSVRQLRDTRLVQRVRSALRNNQLPGEALGLELTESLLMENPAAATVLLEQLRSLKVRVSVDDFGTGYSSLSYLKRFPVDDVKIDQSFVDGLDREDTSDESLVAAIVAMASALGVTTTAEGVETEAQAERLSDLGCGVAQGFLFARPVPPAQMDEVVERLGLARRAHLELVSDQA